MFEFEGFYHICNIQFWIVEVGSGNIAFQFPQIEKLTSLFVEYLPRDFRKLFELLLCFPDFLFPTFRLWDIDNIAFNL